MAKKKINIQITEGCVCYSYLINGVEYVVLSSPDSDYYDPILINEVTTKLVDELEEQYPSTPKFLIDNLYEVPNSNIDIDFSQDVFIDLVKCNKNTHWVDLGTCEDCGDSIERYDLSIELEDNSIFH